MGVFLPLIRVASWSGIDATTRRSPVDVAAVTCTDAVAADARAKSPLLITTSATSRGGWSGGDPAAPNASAVVERHGSGVPPADPGGGKVTSRLATIAPARTLMNCRVRSSFTVPTFAAHTVNCCPATTGSGGLARRKTTNTFAHAE